MFNNVKTQLRSLKNDGTDPRKNDIWRIILFALNNAGGLSIINLLGKWSYFTQNVLQLGIFLTIIIMPMKILDAITDPLIANWFDNFESKHGKYRPAMLIGGIMSFIPGLVIFCYPVDSGLPTWTSYVILSVMYAVIVVGNTILMTATRAGQAVITQDPKQRPIYALGQTVFDAIIMAFITVMITSNIVSDMQDPLVWRISIIVLSVVSILLILIAMNAIKTRDTAQYYKVSKHTEKTSFAEFFRLLKRNKPMRRLVWSTTSDSIAASVRVSLVIYLFANVIMNRELYAYYDILSGIVLGAPVMVIGIYLASKKGSVLVYKNISIIQTLAATLGFILCLIFMPADPTYTYTGITPGIIIVLLVFGLYMSSLGVSSNIKNAIIGDLSDYEYVQSGKFIPGTIAAVLTFANKIITSCVGLISAGIMIFCGFYEAGESSVIPENVFVNYRFYYCIVLAVFILPAIGHLITYIAMRNYPLDQAKMEEVSMILAKERGIIKTEELVEVKE
jgi:Na+/melibiose symporter-like transporter